MSAFRILTDDAYFLFMTDTGDDFWTTVPMSLADLIAIDITNLI